MSEYPVLSAEAFKIFDLIDHPAWLFDPVSLRFIAANSSACQYLGYTRNEMVGFTIADIRPERDRARIREEVDRVRGDRHDPGQWKLIRKDGQLVLASFSWRVVSFSEKKAILATIRDISREKTRQKDLHLLKTAVEHLNDIVLITDADVFTDQGPRIVYANAAFERITGFSKQEVIGKTPRILQGEETSRKELDRLKARLQKSEAVRVELINYKKSGEKMWLELNIVPLFDETGELTNFVAIERDNTERKKSEAARLAIEERFQFVARATSDVIWDWDVNENRMWWSDGLNTNFGVDPGKMGSGIEAWSKQIANKDRRRVLDYLQKILEGDENSWEVEYDFIRGDEKHATICSKGFVIRDGEGKARRVIGSMIDQTSQRELENQVRESQKLEAVGQLTGGVAHDFNNLLTVILGSSEELRDRVVDDTEVELANMVVSASLRASELTSRLLAFSRRQVLRPEVLDANQQLESMQPILVRTLGEDVQVSITRGDNLWMIDVDPGQLEVAILNLAINARHAMPQGGHLSIETVNRTLDAFMSGEADELSAGDYVCISVSDDGEGMDRSTLQKAFEPFFTTKEAGRGSGLGLSMVYGFARQSNGLVKIYSESGVGTTVKLFFPRVDLEPSVSGDSGDVSLESTGSEHILVVEDDELVRRHLVSVLNTLGYHVSEAGEGAEALSILESHADIDLLFTDVVLPGGMSGPQIAEACRSIRPDLRVLFTSGYPASAMAQDGRIGANVELLSKPYRRMDLAKTIRRVLDS